MAGDSGGGRIQAFATIVTTLLAVAAFIQSLSNRQEGASTQTASRKSYGAVGEKIEQLGQAVSSIQGRQPAAAPIAAVAPVPTPHHAQAHPAAAETAPLPAPAPP